MEALLNLSVCSMLLPTFFGALTLASCSWWPWGLGQHLLRMADFHRELHSLCWDPNIHSPVQLRVHSSVPATYPGLEGVTTFVQSPLDMWHVRNTRHQTWLAGKSPWPGRHAGFDGKNHLSMGDFPSRHVCRLPWAIHVVALDGLGEGTSTKVGNPQIQGISEAMTLEMVDQVCPPLSLSLSDLLPIYIYIYACVCVLNINICLVVGFASGFLTSKYLAWKLTGMPKESLERSLSTANPKYWRNIEGTCSRISPYNTCT